SRELLIDPVLTFSTYLGGSGWDSAEGIALDAAGNIYVAGKTYSLDFATTVSNAFSPAPFSSDLFVVKLDPAGSSILSASRVVVMAKFLSLTGFASDPSGNVYLSGGCMNCIINGADPGGFVFKLDADGRVRYGVSPTGATAHSVNGVVADAAGNAYVT